MTVPAAVFALQRVLFLQLRSWMNAQAVGDPAGQEQTATALLAGISAMDVTMSKPNSTKRTSKNKTKQKIDFFTVSHNQYL